MPELATAWITLTANTRGMERDIRQALNRVEDGSGGRLRVDVDRSHIRRQADDAGNEFSRRFSRAAGNARPDFAGNLGKLAGGAFLGGFAASVLGGAFSSIAEKAADQFRSVLETGLDFSKTMNNFQGVTRATTSEMAGMQATARALGSDTTLAGASASSAATAMTELAKAGFSIQDAMGAARGTLELATAGQIDAAQAAEIQSNAMNTFNLNASEAAHVADVLANAAIASSADIPDIGMALAQVGGVAQGFGEDLDDTVAALGMLANAGVKGSDAGTLLKTTLQSITDQGNPAQGAIHDLGLELYKLNDKGQNQFVGFRELFRQLDEAKKRLNNPEQFQALTNVLFGSDAMRGAMLGTVGDFDKMAEALQRTGAAGELANAQMQGLPGAVEGFHNVMESFQLSAFDAVGPAITDGLNGAVQWMSTHQPELIAFFTGIADAALEMAAVTLKSFGLFTDGMGQIIGGLGNVVGLINQTGEALAYVTGDDEREKTFHDAAQAAFSWGESLQAAGQMAKTFDVNSIRDQVRAAGEESANSAKFVREFGENVTLLPGSKTILLKDNSPEAIANIDKTKYAIEQIPGTKDFRVVAKTAEAQAEMDSWRRKQTGETINLKTGAVDMSAAKVSIGNFFAALPPQKIKGQLEVSGTGTASLLPTAGSEAPQRDARGVVIPPRPRAAGGLFGAMPTTAVIQPATSGLIQWAEPSTKGEAFIPLGGGDRSKAIWAQTGHLLGAFDEGGYSGVDAALLSQVPAGRYDASGDLAKGLGDCSSAVEDLVNIMDGASTAGRGMSTGNAAEWLTAHGFVPGSAPGAFNVGFDSSHMQATLPDGTPFNWGSDAAAARGGVGGTGAFDKAFTSHYYRPVAGTAQLGGQYDVDQQAVFDAETRSIKARNDLEVKRKKLAELEAKGTASESQLLAARNDVAEQERDAQSADAKLGEARQGKLRKAKGGSSSGGMDGSSLGESIFGGFLQGMGLDGSVFSNPFEWPNVKSAMAAVNFGGSLLQSIGGGDISGAGGGGGFGIPGMSGLTGMLTPMGGQALTPNGMPTANHAGTGAAPGPALVVNGNVGWDPRTLTGRADAAANQTYRKNLNAVRPGP